MLFNAHKAFIKTAASNMHELIFDLFLQKLHWLNVYQQACNDSCDFKRVDGCKVPQQDKGELCDGGSSHSESELVDEIQTYFWRFFDSRH